MINQTCADVTGSIPGKGVFNEYFSFEVETDKGLFGYVSPSSCDQP